MGPVVLSTVLSDSQSHSHMTMSLPGSEVEVPSTVTVWPSYLKASTLKDATGATSVTLTQKVTMVDAPSSSVTFTEAW